MTREEQINEYITQQRVKYYELYQEARQDNDEESATVFLFTVGALESLQVVLQEEDLAPFIRKAKDK